MRVPGCACTPTERLYDTFEDLDRRTFVAHYPTLSTYPSINGTESSKQINADQPQFDT
jgi:hypothetical protein